ncbi:unnamed protein product [Rhizoctonia solani]|uniref:Uncharacterized protein n=1 Tax=Rhizoctonia solani TaxID=456999 RepID=A0A8H3A9G5_9AGAM|nr:unnamed protein product [Rhizoctonia solani]
MSVQLKPIGWSGMSTSLLERGYGFNIVTVAPSGDASCVNVTNPLVTDPATSTVLVSATSSRSAAAGGTTATDTPNQTPNSRSPVAPIAGGIAGVVVALLILLLCLLWFKRRNKRNLEALHAQNGLSRSEGGYVAEPFMIQAASGAGRVGHTLKMRSTASNLTAPHVDYSSSGISVPIISASDAAPSSSMQSIQSNFHIAGVSRGPVAEGRERNNGLVQEQDAGVSLSEGLQPNGNATLPPAYDSSWRT